MRAGPRLANFHLAGMRRVMAEWRGQQVLTGCLPPPLEGRLTIVVSDAPVDTRPESMSFTGTNGPG